MNSSLILSESESEHRYLLSRLINQNIDNISQSADVRRACTVSDYLPKEERKDLVRGWCDGDETAVATMRDLGKRMEHCNSILDLNHDEVSFTLHSLVYSVCSPFAPTDHTRPKRLCPILPPPPTRLHPSSTQTLTYNPNHRNPHTLGRQCRKIPRQYAHGKHQSNPFRRSYEMGRR